MSTVKLGPVLAKLTRAVGSGQAILQLSADDAKTYNSGSDEGREIDTAIGNFVEEYGVYMVRVEDVYGNRITARYGKAR